MVFIYNDQTNGSFAFKVLSYPDGKPQGNGIGSATRILTEETGFGHMGDVLSYVEEIKNSLENRRYESFRGTLGTSGIRIYSKDNKILMEEDGHQNESDLQAYINDLKVAINEGQQMQMRTSSK